MATILTDIFVTCKPVSHRLELFERSLSSLFENTSRDQYRLTICLDGTSQDDGSRFREAARSIDPDYVIESRENEGLGPTINRAIAHICAINEYYEHPTHGDLSKVAPFITMCQDDLIYSPNWLKKLASYFIIFERDHKIGFASGVECIEHPVRKTIMGGEVVLKDWIRAAQMMGRREYWKSMMPIPRFDPETGRVRAKPNDGIGSGVDWWLIRNHENSICKTGRTCLTVPGLVAHAGYDKSTWLKNGVEMPESDYDKRMVRNG